MNAEQILPGGTTLKKELPPLKMLNQDDNSTGWILLAPISSREGLEKKANSSNIIGVCYPEGCGGHSIN